MNLHTFFHDLCVMELSDLMYGDESTAESPTITMRHKLTPILNSVLSQIYIDFWIQQKELVLRTDANITVYYLRPEHAVSTGGVSPKYIIDSIANPFLGDLVRVDEILDEHGNTVFNNHYNAVGGDVRCPQWDAISFQYPMDNKEYLIRYRVSAPQFTQNMSAEGTSTQLLLPPGFLDLVRCKIAERMYGAQKTQESITKSEHYKMEGAVIEARLVKEGITFMDNIDLNKKPAIRGFP